MGKIVEEFIFYGDDIRIVHFPEETRLLYANPPLEPLADFRQAIIQAINNPIGATPLEKQIKSTSRVTIAFDDPCLPIPLMLNDTRGIVIEELLKLLFSKGIKKEQIQIICANGLHRKWTLKELSIILGKRVVGAMGSKISCHDGTKEDELVFLGTTENGHEVEISRAVVDSDITIYVNLNFTSMNGGWKSIMVGLGSWRSIRHHHTPHQWNGKQSIMNPDSNEMHKILREMGSIVRSKCNVFQIECVVNNQVWPWPLDRMLCPIHSGRRTNQPGLFTKGALFAASCAPQNIKQGVRNLLRSDYKPCAIFAGEVDAVHSKTLDVLFKQQNVKVDQQADILVLGVPNLSPYSSQSVFNPILLRSLTLGYLLGMFRNNPLVKEGGVVVAYNPGIEKFHPQHHPSYIDFWKKDLEKFYDPMECWDALSEKYANNSEYIRKYQDDYAYHGTHCLMNWMWSGMSLKNLNAVILAGARQPDTARKIGFIPEPDFDRAISMAKEMAGRDATITYPVIPPLFCVDVP
jgi:hypothetical protein